MANATLFQTNPPSNPILTSLSSHHKLSSIITISSATAATTATKPPPPLIFNFNSNHHQNRNHRNLRKPLVVKSCLNLPLEPRSSAGKSLSSVLLNDPHSFYDAVSSQLNRLADHRDAAFARFNLSLASPEALLHRRIAELKEAECQLAVEDVLYMIILYKFSEIRVPLVPSLSKCLYNGRLEILPSKDWELESIHSLEVLEMVREHLTSVLGWKAGSSVSVNWSTTKVPRGQLSQAYAASILYGYFLKSASHRLCLEHNLPQPYQNLFGSWTPPPPPPPECGGSHEFGNVVLGQMATPRSTTLSQVSSSRVGKKEKDANLRCYVMGFDTLTKEVCAKLKSEEAIDVIEKHCSALFGTTESSNFPCVKDDEMILTSLSSLKRLVLEAIAFGCFLWDAEQYVSSIYKLKDRN